MNQDLAALLGAIGRRIPRATPLVERLGERRRGRQLVDSGLFDLAWYELQSGCRFPSAVAAASDYVRQGRRAGLSPHPLFEPAWYDPLEWRTRPIEPLVYYLGRLRRRPSKITHPLFGPARYLADHPKSLQHPSGPLGHFMASVTPQTPVDLGHVFDRPASATWGEIRSHLEAVVRQLQQDPVGPAGAVPAQAAAWPAAPQEPQDPGRPLVSIVFPVHDGVRRLQALLSAILAQRLSDLELLVVDAGSTDDTGPVVEGFRHFDPRVRLFTTEWRGLENARNEGLAAALGRYVAFADPGTIWAPDFLQRMVTEMERRALPAARASLGEEESGGRVLPETSGDRAELLAAGRLDLSAVVLRRDLLRQTGGTLPELGSAAGHELLLRVSTLVRVPRLAVLAGVYRPEDDDEDEDEADDGRSRENGHGALESRSLPAADDPVQPADAARARHLLDWDAATRSPDVAGRVAVVIPVVDAARLARVCVAAALRSADRSGLDLEVILVDHGQLRSEQVCLGALTLADPRVRVVRTPPRISRPLAFDAGIAAARAQYVVTCPPELELLPGVLEAIVEALRDESTGCVQPVIVGTDGTVASAGLGFTAGGAQPVPLFRGHPVDDVLALGEITRIPALLGELWGARRADLAAVGGLDCGFAQSWAEADLSLRLAAAGRGSCRLLPNVLAEVSGDARPPMPMPRLVADTWRFVARWRDRLPRQGQAAWALAGLNVAHHQVTRRQEDPSRLRAVVTRPPRLVADGPARGKPSLRWSVKVPGSGLPLARLGREWRFAAQIAQALRVLGQDVVIDGRESYRRPTAYLDDVNLVLRGADPVDAESPATGLLWVIGQPEELAVDELRSYARVLSTSPLWAQRAGTRYEIDVEVLPPATDPLRFRPGTDEPQTPADEFGPDGVPSLLYVGDRRGRVPHGLRNALEIGADLHVFGAGWEDVLPEEVLRGPRPGAERLGELYRRAGVVLLDHRDPERLGGFVSASAYDVLACGSRLACDAVQGLELALPEGPRVWETAPDLAELLDDVQQHFPDRAARLALARTVRDQHSWHGRATRLLDLALAAREGAPLPDEARRGNLVGGA
ncbi:MAG TPA: glycosyltransferase [Kineosporiaceae bacterium]|nr:glycosyltransferase [Kineosporiaceae bacterium]